MKHQTCQSLIPSPVVAPVLISPSLAMKLLLKHLFHSFISRCSPETPAMQQIKQIKLVWCWHSQLPHLTSQHSQLPHLINQHIPGHCEEMGTRESCSPCNQQQLG